MSEHFSPARSINSVLDWLSLRRRVQLSLLGALCVLGAIAELATLGAVLPFLALLAEPESTPSYPLVGGLLSRLQWNGAGIGMLVPAATIFGLVILVAAGIRLCLTWATVRFAQGVGHDLGVRVYERVLHQPYYYHVAGNSSEILAGVTKVDFIIRGILTPALDVLTSAILALAILGGLLLIDPLVALLASSLFGLAYWGLSRYSSRRVIANSRIISRSASSRIQAMQEGLGGIRDVLLDGSQALHVGRYQTHDAALRRAETKNSLWGQAPRYVVEALGIVIIAGLAIFTVSRPGGLTGALPVLGALAIGAQRLLPLFQRIYASWNLVAGNQGNLEDVARLANAPIDEGIQIAGDPSRLPFKIEVTLKGIGFRYREDAPWVIRGLDLTLLRGVRVGFAGETGCGKSTLLDLIMGLLPPTEGHLTVDGERLTSHNLRHWQARIAHVPQSIFLADTTLAANIAFGEPSGRIDMARVEAAARRAKIHDFIHALEEGYATKVGERGVRLSGGQRQRVGIARALYRNADVLVLDEATSALDGETEASVMEGIEEVGDEVTVLIVAHRLSTLDGCDFVVRMGHETVVVESFVQEMGAST